MKLKYINKIKANTSIFSNKKTNNILDGTYKSVYKGKSMNFENLREYVINDDVKDIDWKASARSGTLLVKQFIAEKKHNIMLILDTGKKMDGSTNNDNIKKDVALYTAGTIGYLAIDNGDYVGMCFNKRDAVIYKPFKYNLNNLEQYLTEYDSISTLPNNDGIEKTIKYIYKNIKNKMIIFIITDLQGVENISEKILKELSTVHDVLFINISDLLMFGDNLFDLDDESYIPKMFLNDKKLFELDKDLKKSLYYKNEQRLKKYKINIVTIDDITQINSKIIELLERHRYASKN